MGGREKVSRNIERISTSAALSGIAAGFKIADKLADGLFNMFDPVLTPEERLRGQVASKERDADAQDRIDVSRFTADRAAQRQQELDQLAEAENRRRDRGRER
jgi:hypothetical protein